MFKSILSLLVLCSSIVVLQSQSFSVEKQTSLILSEMHETWNLSEDDVSEYLIKDVFTSAHNGITHVYLHQSRDGVPVHNSIINLHFRDNGSLLFHGNQFVKNLSGKIKNTKAAINAQEALSAFAKHYELDVSEDFQILKSKDGLTTISKTRFSNNDIPIELKYFKIDEDNVVLAWNMEVYIKGTQDYWSTMIDAATGAHLASNNIMLKCAFEPGMFHNHSLCKQSTVATVQDVPQTKINEHMAMDGSRYTVYALPIESPIHGNQSVVQEPALEMASPFGWHDDNGAPDIEYTITKGNNVHAFQDRDGDRESDGDEPDGGPTLNFNFPHDRNVEPLDNILSDVTQLFYTVNYMHDWSYFFGFTEQAGNFQVNNYGKGGVGRDDVKAHALAFRTDNNDEERFNNATFATPRDGSSGVMDMFKFNLSAGAARITVTSPERIAGSLLSGRADFGLTITESTNVIGEIVLADDDAGNENDGCQSIQNGNEVAGKVAMIDRGTCEFGLKALNAQNVGAIGAIICNVPGAGGGDGNNLILLGGGASGPAVNIPVLMLRHDDCVDIKASIAQGEDVIVQFKLQDPPPGAQELSGSFDSGVVAHEFAHGISNRLTGGRNNTSCLNNDEQMGEGWSDFIGLAATHQPGATGADIRGLGVYLERSGTEGRGFRRIPFSTDFTINAQTYNDIRFTESDFTRPIPHPVGEIWAATLWDMYWSFIEAYGYNEDWTDKSSGNYRAIQLVFDGMVMQRCSPGYLDGRDAILAADEALFNGENQCLIWNSFARRGLGVNASQGSTNDRNDNFEGFETLPSCRNELLITKTMTEQINAGDDVEVSITIINNKTEGVTGLVVTDEIPSNATFISASSNVAVSQQGDMVVFTIGNLNAGQEFDFIYSFESAVEDFSTSLLFDNFASETTLFEAMSLDGTAPWVNLDSGTTAGTTHWNVPNEKSSNDQTLQTAESIRLNGNNPAIRFTHKYDTELFYGSGIVEISTDNGNSWRILTEENILLNPYKDEFSFFAIPLPNGRGYTGTQNSFIDTYIDVSEFRGLDVLFRFRFGSDVDPNRAPFSTGGDGWTIENFQLLDLKVVGALQACATTNQNDDVCASAYTIVRPESSTSTQTVLKEEFDFLMFPNPSSGEVNIQFTTELGGQAGINIYTIDGRLVDRKNFSYQGGTVQRSIEMQDFQSGMYLIEIRTEAFTIIDKLLLEQ